MYYTPYLLAKLSSSFAFVKLTFSLQLAPLCPSVFVLAVPQPNTRHTDTHRHTHMQTHTYIHRHTLAHTQSLTHTLSNTPVLVFGAF